MTGPQADLALQLLQADLRTPEMEMAEIGGDVGDAASMPIEENNPANPHPVTRR